VGSAVGAEVETEEQNKSICSAMLAGAEEGGRHWAGIEGGGLHLWIADDARVSMWGVVVRRVRRGLKP
jgi:hypothetical protein